MHNSRALWDPLSVKVCHLINEGKVLEQHRSLRANCQCGTLAVSRMALTGCHDIWDLRGVYRGYIVW